MMEQVNPTLLSQHSRPPACAVSFLLMQLFDSSLTQHTCKLFNVITLCIYSPVNYHLEIAECGYRLSCQRLCPPILGFSLSSPSLSLEDCQAPCGLWGPSTQQGTRKAENGLRGVLQLSRTQGCNSSGLSAFFLNEIESLCYFNQGENVCCNGSINWKSRFG